MAASARDHGRGGATRVGVGATPGKTKHFQTVELGVLPLHAPRAAAAAEAASFEPERAAAAAADDDEPDDDDDDDDGEPDDDDDDDETDGDDAPTGSAAAAPALPPASAPADGAGVSRVRATLCDCPGLVFPSFVSSAAEMLVCGVLPINTMAMRDALPPAALIAARVPRSVLDAVYGLPPRAARAGEEAARGEGERGDAMRYGAAELLDALCAARGFLGHSGAPEWARAVRKLVIDYIAGALLHCDPPPAPPRDAATGEAEAAAAAAAAAAAFRADTLATALRRDARLRAKLAKAGGGAPENAAPPPPPGAAAAGGGFEDAEFSVAAAAPDALFDELLLPAAPAAPAAGGRKIKWGKKGRKLRDKDPYAEAGADQLLAREAARSGGAGALTKGRTRLHGEAVRL